MHALAKDRFSGDPTVDPAPVVADLKPFPLDRFDQMKVLRTFDFAKHDVAHLDVFGIDGFDGAKLTLFDFPGH